MSKRGNLLRWCAALFALTILQARAQERPAEVREIALTVTLCSDAQTVAVAGTFNNWDRKANLMTRQADSKTWSLTLRLAPGVHAFKYVVDGERWMNDPRAPRQDDGNGNINSLLTVAPLEYEQKPGKVGDGVVTATGVAHQPTLLSIRREDRKRLTLSLRTRHDDVQRCWIEVKNRAFPMRRIASDTLYDTWRATLTLSDPKTLRYRFRVQDGAKTFLWGKEGALRPLRQSAKPIVIALANFPPFETPNWARDAVFYQIFPDRFHNGDATNDPPDVVQWEATPTFFNWMGGDLQGVTQKMDYLQNLGINALYLNPIFQARSNHAYDTTDYRRIDPRFGDAKTLTELTAQAHQRGWRVMLDAVFNHTGVDFFAFDSLRNEGERSPYRSWYFVKGFPIEVKDGQTNYEGWFGTPWMPKLNVENPETRAYLMETTLRWMRETKVDGWRLDVGNEISPNFWKTFRRTVRKQDPNAYIVGEVWTDASAWLQGDQWDAAMNYPWRFATLDFFVNGSSSPSQFDKRLAQVRNAYPPQATAVMFNMLGSHDTERLRTLCKGDRAKERQAVLFQMTYPGAPCIYYGDEIGMEGGRDPDNRRGMIWDEARWDNELLAFYKRLLSHRRRHLALRRGDFQTVLTDDNRQLYGFLRSYGEERALVLFNRSDQPQPVTIPLSRFNGKLPQDWLGDAPPLTRDGDNLTFTLPAKGIALLGVGR